MTHHVALMEGENGNAFTFEKNKECILVQSCCLADLSADELISWRDGKKREELATMIPLLEETEPRHALVAVIILHFMNGLQ